jgi:HCOMODA/2-hydroxy-3-carboxy-muconic semialdehyde decarboxylase
MTTASSAGSRIVRELVLANHILALEEVLDAYGHVSVRNPADPNTFLMSRSRSPGDVTGMVEKDLDRERFIHGSIYEARPDVHAVIHSHADDVLPFGVSSIPLIAIAHGASGMGASPVPVWDMRTEFGDTNLLVTNVDHGRSLSRKLEDRTLVLMRGHGFAAAGKTLINVIKMATALPKNARALLDAINLGGEITGLSAGECALRDETDVRLPAAQRQWEYWSRRLGVAYEPGGY